MSWRGRPFLLLLLQLWPCALLFNAAETHAQTPAPPLKIIGLAPLSGWVELGVRGRNNRRRRSNADTSFDQNDLKLDEVLHTKLDGYFLYPRLARFRAAVELHFLQNLSTEQEQILPLGDFSLNFLEKKPYGLTLFAHVSDEEVEESFGRSSETRVENYGSSLRVGLGPLPFRLRYMHRVRDRDRSADGIDDAREEGDELDFLGTYRLGPKSDGDVRFLYSDTKERGNNTVRHEVLVNNLTYFDPQQRKRFTGLARYYDWSGQSDSSNATLLGVYDWQHTDRISSSYQANYQHRTFGGQTTDFYDANVTVSHRLYSSLQNSLSLSGNLQDAAFGKISEIGVRIRESYTKHLGGWGQLAVGLSPYTQLRFTRPKQDTAFVNGDRVLIPDITPVQLRQQDIDTSTIVVTSTDGLITYLEEIDYTIRVNGRWTEIERLLTGTLPPDTVVLVDYEYALGEKNDLLLYGHRSDVTLSYGSWGSLFANLSNQREEVVSGFSDRRLEDRDRYEVGLRARQRWLSAMVSFDWEKTSFRPSRGTLQTLSLSTPWTRRWRGSMSVSHSTRDYRDPSEEVERWRLHARASFQLGSRVLLEIEPEYRNENWRGGFNSGARDLEAVGGRASIRWHFRALELKMEGSIFSLNRAEMEDLQDRYFVRLRRRF